MFPYNSCDKTFKSRDLQIVKEKHIWRIGKKFCCFPNFLIFGLFPRLRFSCTPYNVIKANQGFLLHSARTKPDSSSMDKKHGQEYFESRLQHKLRGSGFRIRSRQGYWVALLFTSCSKEVPQGLWVPRPASFSFLDQSSGKGLYFLFNPFFHSATQFFFDWKYLGE